MKILSLNRNQIKYIVIVAMLIDHIAWAFVPTESPLGQIMHFIGRLTGPTMAYFIVEGYLHTRSVKKYAVRLGIFALISWPAYTMFRSGSLPLAMVGGRFVLHPDFGVIYTLFLCLLSIWLLDKGLYSEWEKLAAIMGLCALSVFGDWAVWDILYSLIFFIYRDDRRRKWKAFAVISTVDILSAMLSKGNPALQIWKLGVFMIPPFIELCYNGESGSRKQIHKWFFYVFYPVHLLVLAMLK